MLGESKFRILESIPDSHKPKTSFYSFPFDAFKVTEEVEGDFSYPLIAKPDIGERGWGVAKISSKKELLTYLAKTNVNILVQEYISQPLELGVFYYRFPDATTGNVTSIVQKQMLSVTGDGVSTIHELISKSPRAILQYDRIKRRLQEQIYSVLPKGQYFELEPIGNHSRGTRFINANNHITKALVHSMDSVSKQIPSFFFGRFDLRCNSYHDLESGRFKIMELNGAGAEPAHIYQPGTTILVAYKAIFKHLSILQKISAVNHQKGIRYMSLSEGYKEWRKLSDYNKKKTTAVI